ncbi:MAG: hypothetical protein AVDCRST_MAG89-1597, partial [uncultured Gemmatimonadetes bacterium]
AGPALPRAVHALHSADAAAPDDDRGVPRHPRRAERRSVQECPRVRAGEGQGRGRRGAQRRLPPHRGGHRHDPPGAGHLRHLRRGGRAHRRAAAGRDRAHLRAQPRRDAARVQRAGARALHQKRAGAV